MIHFKRIKFSNFLSVGDQPTIIQLDKTITTVVTGKNGAGKSTFIDALVYALFGKPFRKVRLGQLINNVNEGSLEVEISFSAGSKDYIVKRGMKPAVFEIYSNGEMIPQPAITADYQHILENDILKLNYKSFTQIIILGSASFVPFMQLKLGDRREIIENLLDISVFTEMNKILKSKIKELKEDITDTEHKLDLTKQKHKSNREFFIEATDVRQKMFKTFDGQINDAQANMRFRDMDMLGCKEHIDEIENSMLSCEGYGDKLISVTAQIETIKRDIDAQQTRFDLLCENNELVSDIRIRITKCKNEITEFKKEWTTLTKKSEDLKEVIDSYPNIDTERDEAKTAIITLSNSIIANNIKLEFYQKNDLCPECKQDLEKTFTEDMIGDIQCIIAKETEDHDNHKARLEQYNKDKADETQFIDDHYHLRRKITGIDSDIKTLVNSIDLMTEDIRTRDTKDPAGMGDLKHYIGTLEADYDKEVKGVEDVKKKHEEYLKLEGKLNEVMKDLALDEQAIKTYSDSIKSVQAEIKTLKDAPVCSITQDDIDVLVEEVKEYDKAVVRKKYMFHYYGIVQKLLKDDGLKTKIIRKFLPVINATVNMYLDKFDFPINFEFDENFNETIQSNFRNDFSYYSFSEGEKSRIDLALLFTWREISLKKARNASNIIIFDEIFDGSLDGDGIENFMSILGLDEEGYSSFIISHKDETINSRFDRNLDFAKDGHFSKIMEK